MPTYISGGDKISLVDAQGKNYRLRIELDDDAESPRDWDNVSTMSCWHRRYTLGDEQPSIEPREFIADLVQQYNLPSLKTRRAIVGYVKSGRSDTVRLSYNRHTKTWEILSKAWWLEKDKWFTYDTELQKLADMPDWFVENLINEMSTADLDFFLANSPIAILPLYLYDHSGITMNTTGFSCQWDSGQVGWIHVDKAKAISEWGLKDDPNWKAEAEERMRSEVNVYDQYLTGSVYGYVLEEIVTEGDDEEEYVELDSCWGFYGDTLEDSCIMEYVGTDYKVA